LLLQTGNNEKINIVSLYAGLPQLYINCRCDCQNLSDAKQLKNQL